MSVHCSLVATYWERDILFALLFVIFSCVFVTFPCGVVYLMYQFPIFAFFLTLNHTNIQPVKHKYSKRFVTFSCTVTSTGSGGFMVSMYSMTRSSRRLNQKWFWRSQDRTWDPWFTRHSLVITGYHLRVYTVCS